MGSGRYCFSPLAEYSRYTCVDEDDDVLELLARTAQSSSNCQIFVHLLSPILFFSNFGYPLILFSSCCFLSLPEATACRSAICSPLFLSCTSFVSATPSLYSLILASYTRQGLLDNLSDSFSTCVFVWFDRSSMRCQRCTTRRTSSVIMSLKFSKNGKSSWLSLQKSFRRDTSAKDEVVF